MPHQGASWGASCCARASRRSSARPQTSELKRSLGPWNLVFLGIGCIIGAGIFVRTGNAAALHAGPAVLLSFVIAGIVCAFAGLCYAELSSTLPVSGSAYTYSYTTIGEFAAWVMGALLLLEYGLAASVVAVGWSGYVVSLLGDIGIVIPPEFTGPAGYPLIRDGATVLVNGAPVTTIFNLPAFLVCTALALLLVVGVSESAKVNNVIVAIKVTVLAAFILVGGFIILSNSSDLRAQLGSVHPAADRRGGRVRLGRHPARRLDRLLRLYRLRGGLDRRPGGQEPGEGHAVRDHRLAASPAP